jgi:hypothetical protein
MWRCPGTPPCRWGLRLQAGRPNAEEGEGSLVPERVNSIEGRGLVNIQISTPKGYVIMHRGWVDDDPHQGSKSRTGHDANL